MGAIDIREKRNDRLKQIYFKLIDTVQNAEKSIFDRTNVFLAITAMLLLAFTQLLTNAKTIGVTIYLIVVLIPVIGLFICLFEFKLVLSIMDSIKHWRKKIISIENDADFWYPLDPSKKDSNIAVYEEKTLVDIEKHFGGLKSSRNPLKHRYYAILSLVGIEKYFVSSSEIYGLYIPVIVAIIWAAAALFLMIKYYLAGVPDPVTLLLPSLLPI